MTTTIKITQLSDIGANLASSTILPVVNMTGIPVTQKTSVGNLANVILNGAGTDYVGAASAVTVSGNLQPNITSVGNLIGLTVSNSLATVNFINTSNVSLGAAGRVHITGGINGQVLTTNGAGNLTWANASGTANTGNITFNGDEIASTNDVVNIVGNNYAQLQSSNTSMWVENGEADIDVNGNRWIFNNQGYMEIPNDGSFGALNTGVLSFSSQNNRPIYIEVIDTGNSAAKQWVFDNQGNLTLPSNTFAVNYANGTQVNIGGSGANTGNVTFNDVNIIGDGNLYLQPDPNNAGAYLDVYLTSGPDIHLVASSSANLILGKDDGANVMTSWDGNVTIQSWSTNTDTQGGVWTFDGDGTLTLPNDANIATIGNVTQFNTCANGFLGLNSYDAGGNNIARVGINSADTMVSVGVSDPITEIDYNWSFNNGGGTIFPTLTVDLHNGGNQTAQTLQFGDSTKQAVITGPAPATGQSAQRLIIQGQRANGTYSEGGDVYIWGGDSDYNGGDIKIYAGDSDGANGGGGYINLAGGQGPDTGGYINIDGGQSLNGPGGYVHITSGSGATSGGEANINGGYGTITGGNVNITGGAAGASAANYGNVNINAGASTWTFDNSGNLQAPGAIVGPAGANLVIYANAGVHNFTFGDDGTFYAPDNVVLSGTSISIGPGANAISLTNAVLVASSNSDAYIQGVIYNVSDIGSADWVAEGHRGDDNGGWTDMGFASCSFSDPAYTITGPGDGYLFAQSFYNGQAPGGRGGNLVLATGENGTVCDIIFGTSGFLAGNIFGRISHANNSFELSRTGATITFPDATEQNTAWTGNVAGANVTGTVANANLSQYLAVSDVNNNFSYHVVLSAGSGDKSLHIDADDNLQYNPADGTLTSVRVDATYVLANLNYANGYLASNLVGSISTIANGNSNVNIPTSNGNVVITTNGTANWILDTTGNLTLPTGGQIIVSGGLVSSGASPAPTINGFSIINSVGISGSGNISGNNISATGNITVTGTTNTGINSIVAGVTNTLLPNTVTSFSANVNSYTQVTLQNKSNGADATTDYIITADNGSDTVNYADFGIINSGYDNGTPTNSLGNIVYAADTYLYAQGNVGNTSQSGGNLAIGTTVPGKNVKIFAGGVNNSSIVANIANTGVAITGNLSVSGNITGNTNGFTIGYLNIPQVAASNTTIGLTDAGKHYYSTTAGNFTLTVPNNATTGFATGTAISIVVQAAGNILVNAASGVTLYMAGNSTAANRVVGGYGMATLMKVASDTWFINGTGVS